MIRLLIFSSLVLFACSREGASISGTQTTSDAKAALGPQEIAVGIATPAQCPAGGSVLSVYYDQNGNGLYDSTDVFVSSQIICNGSSGANGHSTLINASRVSIGLSACTSGSGIEINVGLDSNDNGVLDASEISSPQVVCDGQTGATGSTGSTGATGSAGSPGANGMGMVFQVVAAQASVCPAGGSTILMALDSDRSGTLTSSDQNYQSTTLCNGQPAQNSSYTPVEPILACGNNVAYKEVLLRLSNGQVLGSFSDTVSGSMTRLAFIPDGTYQNTDNSGCVFSLATSSDRSTRSISWSGAVQESWPMIY